MHLRLTLAALLSATILVSCSSNESLTSSAVTAAEGPSPTAAAPASSGSQATGTATSSLGPAEHDGERAMEHVRALATIIGPRVAGTDAEKRAADYIANQFRADGYDVEVMEFSFDGDRFRSAKLTLDARTFEVTTAANSSGGNISGPSVFVGLGDATGIGGRSLTGKIAVADRGTLTFGEKAENVISAGAAGLVILNNQPGGVSADLRKLQSLPVVAASGEDADTLRAAAQAGKSLAIDSSPPSKTAARNVIARPKAGAACNLLVGGHYDTVISAPGANDNASGAANVVELARAFATDGLDDGLCFAAFSAEESGIYGSGALAQRFKSEGRLPKLMVNLDVTGIGNRVELIGDRDYVTQTLAIAERLNIPAIRSQLPPNTGSDHLSFQQVGVPILYFTSGEFVTIHSPADVTRDVEASELDRIGDLAYAAIIQLLPKVARG